MKTTQEVFDIAATHLLTQKAQARGVNGNCAYRGDSGHMCAVGALIADEHYDPEFEGEASDNPAVHDALCKSGIDADSDRSLLLGLQSVHDEYPPDAWLAELGKLAKEYSLVTDALAPFQPSDGPVQLAP